MKRLFVSLGLILALSSSPIVAQTISADAALEALPEIGKLSSAKDPLFKQHQELVSLYYQADSQHKPLPDLTLFRYTIRAEDSLFSLSGAFNLPYETISTLNGLQTANDLDVGRTILVPSQPGLFVSLDTPGLVDRLMASWRLTDATRIEIKVPRTGHLENVLFLPGQRFHDIERAFFLGILFRFPLPQGRLTSSFGMRISPFTGHPLFHNGIDLGAPYGTEVFAAREGRVSFTGKDQVLGNFIKIEHQDGYETVYGHLSQIGVSLNQSVLSGTMIGRVGTTGMSTGPHLHFEVRRQGHPQDPVPLLPTAKR